MHIIQLKASTNNKTIKRQIHSLSFDCHYRLVTENKACYLHFIRHFSWKVTFDFIGDMSFWIETGFAVAFLVIVHTAIYAWVSKKPLRSIRDRHVVITGGSSGIGFWIAVNCVKLGAHVTLIARNVDNLEAAVEKIKLHRVSEKQLIQFRSVDLSKNYDAVEEAFTSLEDEIAPIYWLVNCAGGAICGRVDEMSPDDAVYLMNINYYAVYYPTRFVLTKMKKVGDGIITITGSQASLMGVYGLGPYAAAKFALRGLAETIAMEVSNTKISVTLALPADTGKSNSIHFSRNKLRKIKPLFAFSIIDTPGFDNENKTKPEETKIISAGAGISKPEDVADKIVLDSLVSKQIYFWNSPQRHEIIRVFLFRFRVVISYRSPGLKAGC